eukprot:m.351963 g.351963  ORF g.351963 m.351963 type:complete len:414 (-) comp16414_c0_seq1:123-1364(-)
MRSSNLLIQLLWKKVYANVVLVCLGPKLNLGKNLVAKAVAHDKRWMAGSATKVDKATLCKQNNVVAARHFVALNLWLDVEGGLCVGLEPCNVNLAVKVTNVAHNGIVLHLCKVSTSDNTLAASSGDVDHALLGGLLHGGHLVTLHSSLESVDWVNLSDENAGTKGTEGLGTTLAHITVASNDGSLACNHNVSCALDTVEKRLTAAVEVVELALGNRVVDVDCRDLQLASLEHLVQVMHTCGGLLRNTLNTRKKLRVLAVHKVCEVTSIIEDHVEWLSVWKEDGLLDAPHVLFVGLTLPCVHWHTSGSDGSGSLVLSGEDVAGGPSHLCTKRSQGLDQHSGLGGHVQAASNARTLEWLLSTVLLTKLHQARHLVFTEHDVLAASLSEVDVGNFVCGLISRHGDGVDCDECRSEK